MNGLEPSLYILLINGTRGQTSCWLCEAEFANEFDKRNEPILSILTIIRLAQNLILRDCGNNSSLPYLIYFYASNLFILLMQLFHTLHWISPILFFCGLGFETLISLSTWNIQTRFCISSYNIYAPVAYTQQFLLVRHINTFDIFIIPTDCSFFKNCRRIKANDSFQIPILASKSYLADLFQYSCFRNGNDP